MNTLFDIPAAESQPKKPKGDTCRLCIYRYRHEYGNMTYCGMQKDTRTAYGHKKIKAGDPACEHYTKTEKS